MVNNKLTVQLKWTATVLTLIGALLTSLAIDPVNVWFLNLGSILFVIWAVRIKDLAMITVNSGLLLIYTVGTIWRLI